MLQQRAPTQGPSSCTGQRQRTPTVSHQGRSRQQTCQVRCNSKGAPVPAPPSYSAANLPPFSAFTDKPLNLTSSSVELDLPPQVNQDQDGISCARELYDRVCSSGTFLGPVQVTFTPGFGPGLTCVRQVEPGEVLLTCKPLGPLLLYGQPGQAPPVRSLVKKMMRSMYTPTQLKWIELLHYQQLEDHHLDELRDLMEQDSDVGKPSHFCPALNPEALEHLVYRASHSKPFQDLALVQCLKDSGCNGPAQDPCTPDWAGEIEAQEQQQAAAEAAAAAAAAAAADASFSSIDGADGSETRFELGQGFTGVWPAYSLLHHSCVPNANVMVLGSTMVVRAAKHLKVNTLVRVSKIGDAVLLPREDRHAKLRSRHIDGCHCRRCRYESGLPPDIKVLINSVHGGCSSLKPFIEQAVQQDDHAAVRKAGAMLSRFRAKVQKVLGQENMTMPPSDLHTDSPEESAANAPPPQTRSIYGNYTITERQRAWVQASIYSLYDMYTEYFAVGDMELLSAVVDLISEAFPGTELHVAMATKYLQAVRQTYAAGTVDAQMAEQVCYEAHLARYGRITRGLMEQLIEGAQKASWANTACAYDRIAFNKDL